MREPIEVIYRFARGADDIADEGDDPPQLRLEKLRDYRRHLEAPSEAADIIRQYELPAGLFEDLLDAFTQDVTKKRYADYAEVLDYCRRSANPVGRLLLHLFKRTSETDLRRSDAVCSALQLINFWQDVDIDYTKDQRVYLPQDELARFGVSEEHLQRKTANQSWRNLMAFQVERTRRLMLEGAPLGRDLPGRVGLEIRTTLQGGLSILDKLQSADYDMFRRRPVLRWFDWPLVLLKAL